MKSIALILCLVLLLPVTGCTVSDSQIRADGHAIAVAVQQISVVIKATNPDAADKLSMAATALESATANYQSGNTTAIIETAANALSITLSAIPQTSAYAPLVAIAVAAIDVLLANLPQGGTVKAMAQPKAPNPYSGQAVIKHRALRSPEGDFKAAFNEKAQQLGVPKI